MIVISDVLLTVFYAFFGIILMIIANTMIDFFIPGDFSDEIKRGNRAVAWLSAGSFIGIGEILRAVIMSPRMDTIEIPVLDGIIASLIYSALGIVLFVAGYTLVNLWHRKYNLSEEIMRGNTAAGILVFGIFVGLSLVISAAVY